MDGARLHLMERAFAIDPTLIVLFAAAMIGGAVRLTLVDRAVRNAPERTNRSNPS